MAIILHGCETYFTFELKSHKSKLSEYRISPLCQVFPRLAQVNNEIEVALSSSGENAYRVFKRIYIAMGQLGIPKRRQEDVIKVDCHKVCVRMEAWLHNPDSGLGQMADVGINSNEPSGPSCQLLHINRPINGRSWI